MHFHCNINGDFIRLVSFYFSGCKILHTVEKASFFSFTVKDPSVHSVQQNQFSSLLESRKKTK